ncbi:FecR family protein [Joostella sp. CR20]|uniref:FecR family protein n=1 Tax=Joostella sp. CR20 TaxID=2804312 RepID=UPI00313BD4A7
MKEQNLHKLLDKYHRGECTSEEQSLVDNYLDRFQEKSINALENESEVKNRIYFKIKASIQQKKKFKRHQKQKRMFSAIAAVLVSVIGIGVLFQLFTNDIEYKEIAALGERKIIELSDGSKVFLNSGSTLTYTSAYNKRDRKVNLSGEAFFEVAHNKEKPFIVKTTHLQTRVLGTSFNINSYPENKDFKVSVTTGKVEVTGSFKDSVYLVKDEQIVFNVNRGTYKKEFFESSDDIVWKDNVILFNDIPLESAIIKLEKWFDVNIMVNNEELNKHHINGKFINPSLNEVLESLQFSLQFTVEYQSKNELIINKKDM